MARAKRHYISGYVWHITHRCHKREFLLKFPRDRRRWIEWLYQAKKRYGGLSVLNYNEIQNPKKRKGIIDFDRLIGLLGFKNYDDLKAAHYKWVESEMPTDGSAKENKWTQSIAVGSKPFIETLGIFYLFFNMLLWPPDRSKKRRG